MWLLIKLAIWLVASTAIILLLFFTPMNVLGAIIGLFPSYLIFSTLFFE
ncbi:hypothetical protein LCGC14_1233230 [marine sediment metagenome]|uniref:Uncharacterized protein n=1 Tax=marine sediment metagenome TaxID=412755 RepID=A0A0F9LV66_9ZZZZ